MKKLIGLIVFSLLISVGINSCSQTSDGETPAVEFCGDGSLDPGEQCDDGNNEDGDGCSADCSSTEICGNSIVDPGETCDDSSESATCNADCSAAVCGDGQTNTTSGETCDDGNTDPDDGCDASCQRGCTGVEPQMELLKTAKNATTAMTSTTTSVPMRVRCQPAGTGSFHIVTVA